MPVTLEFKNSVYKSNWTFFIAAIFIIKIFIFLLDPLPMFLMGDSHSYITTALTGWIPPDRSFTYGYFIKYTAVASHSLTTLILLQSLMSGINAILLSYMLIRFFSVRPLLSFISGILCAIEPLQLLYERYVMTESLSLFLFVLYLLIVFIYIKKPNLIKLFISSFIGTLLISVRLSFLPIVLLNSVIIPLLGIKSLSKSQNENYSELTNFIKKILSHKKLLTKIFMHLTLSIVFTISLHTAYKNLNGYLSDKPPAYLYHGGFFLISYFSPIIEPDDFPDNEIRYTVFKNLKYDMKDPHKRAIHHWEIGGIVNVLNRYMYNSLEADNFAKKVVINSLKRNPIGFLKIAYLGFIDYWNIKNLKNSLVVERGEKELPDYLLVKLRNYFSLNADKLPFLLTFTNKYYFKAWAWYLFLLCSPLLGIITIIFCKKIRRYLLIVFLSLFIIIIITCVLIDGITVRYLHPAGWLIFFIITTAIDYLVKRLNNKKSISSN